MAATTDSSTRRSRMVTGLFKNKESAERAYSSLARRGYSRDDVNLLMLDETRDKHFPSAESADTDLSRRALEGAGLGSAIGGTLGATLAALAAVGTTIAFPGLGLLIAGPLAAALAGAGAGGMTGGLVGALVGAGFSEERAAIYESGIRQGGMVMSVNARTDEDADYFENEWKNSGGEHVQR
jgi:hypothetical protein